MQYFPLLPDATSRNQTIGNPENAISWSAAEENGLTLVELLVSLVVVGLLATAIFSFFLNTSQSVNQQSANGEMWQRGRNALTIMRQAIESAGYGLPSYSQCPNGIVGINSTGTQAGALVAITASVQSAGSSYDPSSTSLGGISTYQFQTVIGGGSFGGAPATTVQNHPGKSSGLFVSNTAPLDPGDLALIAPQGGGTCLLGQITNVVGKGTVNTDCNGYTGKGELKSDGHIEFNSGSHGNCFQANPTQIFSLLTGTAESPSLSGANLYDLGSQSFLFAQFSIQENPAGSTPTLYMTQYTGLQATPPTPQALATGVVDIQMQYGIGSNGSVQSWVSPENFTPSATQSIVAVQLAMLIRSTQYLPNSLSPATFSILGNTYKVPTTGGPGCLQGNCRHYEYHLFQTVIPVRNGIWGSE
ncbi:PilW family protein [Acidithiobacillus montserratensis]|uniref:PilW family protein n=1 Tax=Acidithiobacillus montserratensis TaxID=2729135 RepID=A0ACD5HJ04_9PROT|nr:PilW family protein [Acidithiobacillus montserratensis]MBN2680649.1 PilW family protein [Acidithiobacillaceae bacterium]MBU2748726.1 prepilin-type N-terminal cleavage/methylation domain-containing protein [Acidithiobacillus montserratensis]